MTELKHLIEQKNRREAWARLVAAEKAKEAKTNEQDHRAGKRGEK